MYHEVYPIEILQGFTESDSYLLMVTEPKQNLNVPIIIGEHEAEAIIIAKEQIKARRPMTHHLLCNIMSQYNLSLKQVTIDRFFEGIFYSTLYMSDGFNEKQIDSRTSDAVTLALMNNCPILMDDSVLRDAGVEPNTIDKHQPLDLPDNDLLDSLEEKLRKCEENEEYEMAAEIQRQIDMIKGK